ncbi:MAG: ATP-binding protein [Flavobacteriales bacterium]
MTEPTKKQVQLLLKAACEHAGSQGIWSKRHEVSSATVSNILAGKWSTIADKMWLKVAAALKYQGLEWQTAHTADFVLMQEFCRMAQAQSASAAVSYDAGGGKTHALQHYAAKHKNVFVIQCAEYWTKKLFLSSLYRSLGKDPSGRTCPELAEGIIAELRQLNKPLMVIDEIDKLRDPLVMYYIELYNKLDGICGFLLVGAPHLRIAWERNAQRDKRGFKEIYSRVGRRFLRLNGVKQKDVALICEANGVGDAAQVQAVWNAIEDNKDLRRVKREIERIHMGNKPLADVA